MSLKEQILELKQQGKSYKEISELLNCSKGTISFHCNPRVKERALFRQSCDRRGIPFEKLVYKSDPLTKRYCKQCASKEVNLKSEFCSVRCHKDYVFNVRYNDWLNGKLESSRDWLRKALTRLQGYTCSECGVSSWNDKPIVLEVEHKDGCAANDEISNLCLICPNCHSQTDSYKGRNLGKGRKSLGMKSY